MPVSGQQQFLVSWSSPRVRIDAEYWETFSGYDESIASMEHYNGGSNDMEVWFDRIKRADVTITRAHQAPRDRSVIAQTVAVMGSAEKGVLTVQHVDRDLVPDEEPLVITGFLIGIKTSQVDVNQSGSKAMIELVIKPVGLA